jgi:hypothetical protein
MLEVCGIFAPDVKALMPRRPRAARPNGRQTSRMPRTVLADNLRALMEAHDPPLSGRQVGLKVSIDPKTVTRILAKQHAPNLDTIAALAALFDLLPWQLLVPGMDPKDPPVTQLSRNEDALYRKLRTVASEFGKLEE